MEIAIILGSVREGRLGLRAVHMLQTAIAARGDIGHLVDPMQHKLPLLNRRIVDYPQGQIPAGLAALSALFRAAHAFILVTAEYNHNLPPALINLIDHFGTKEFGGRPAGIVSYSSGSFGGARAAQQARLLMPALGAITIPTVLSIPELDQQMDAAGGLPDASPWRKRTATFLDDLAAWAKAAPGHPEWRVPPQDK